MEAGQLAMALGWQTFRPDRVKSGLGFPGD